ncbi:MAG: hypothetical protein ABI140_16095 [Jatrophihabitantaceae bacterium]
MTTTMSPRAGTQSGAGLQPAAGRASRRRTLGFCLILLAIACSILAGRVILTRSEPQPPAVTLAHPAAAVPASPAIEASWGIRFTDVIMLADNGGIELRYQVIDVSKADKIHLGDPTSNELPTIRVDGRAASVTPSSVLMHFHHGDSADGRSYSIVYGNAGGVVKVGDYVTIVMKDGSKLAHAQVSS